LLPAANGRNDWDRDAKRRAGIPAAQLPCGRGTGAAPANLAGAGGDACRDDSLVESLRRHDASRKRGGRRIGKWIKLERDF
jgi:hypothetical protein